MYVVVSGPPGAGKSTLAAPLAAALGLPLLAKDTIKEALVGSLGAADVEASRTLGRAAMAVLFAVAAEAHGGAVLEAAFHRSYALPALRALPGPVVEVFCRCDRVVVTERYRRRAASRDAGHFDDVRTPEELWNDEVAVPVAGGWALLEVDTSVPVDVDAVVAAIRRSAG